MATAPKDIFPGESRLVVIEDMLDWRFRIPQFQRPYDWTARQIDDFIADLTESAATGIPLFMGLAVVHRDSSELSIVDGQQRLTTVMLALATLEGSRRAMCNVAGIDIPWICPRRNDVAFARSLIRSLGKSANAESPTTQSQWLMTSAVERLQSRLGATDLAALLKAEMIVYVAPSLAGATRLFERINLRGKKVSEFDLVKNKLIELAAIEQDESKRLALVDFITSRYDTLYTLLDPRSGDSPYESDRLLKVHWILYADTAFVSGDRVLDKFNNMFRAASAIPAEVSRRIQTYLDSLVQVASVWVWIERPYAVRRPEYGSNTQKALLDFAKLDRRGEIQPLIVASILRFGRNAAKFVAFAEIDAFRSAMARKRSNFGRALKWRLARELHAGSLLDAQGDKIDTVDDLIHQVFWRSTPYWSRAEARHFDDAFSAEEIASQVIPEDALDHPKFFSQYNGVIHYLFWKYGAHLLNSAKWRDMVRVDIVPFQESVWFGDPEEKPFRKWDIEHIYALQARDRDTPAGRAFARSMADWVGQLGNLTVLPYGDNRAIGNLPFVDKLDWMIEQAKVSFNKLLGERKYTGNLMDAPHWGPHNCRRRVADIKLSADSIWGLGALKELKIQPFDNRVLGYEPEEDEEDDATVEQKQLPR